MGSAGVPLLVMCWLCCWPGGREPGSDAPDGEKHSKKSPGHQEGGGGRGAAAGGSGGSSRARSFASLRLHVPLSSGEHSRESLSAHRSHEDIPVRRRSDLQAEETRYHSAPSVIDEVIHRRDWDRSSRDVRIPLTHHADLKAADLEDSDASSPEAPRAEPEASSIEGERGITRDEESERPRCKKHYKNIKSSKNRTHKEALTDDFKDTDATEISNFYIGENSDAPLSNSTRDINNDILCDDKGRYQAKEYKQSINESIKTKDRPGVCVGDELSNIRRSMEGYQARMLDMEVEAVEPDRSGAMHRASVVSWATPPTPSSVEAVGYELSACYLSARPPSPPACPGARARHASDGELLAPVTVRRPESGAFSESDLELELELELQAEQPPPYHQLAGDSPRHDRPARETAI